MAGRSESVKKVLVELWRLKGRICTDLPPRLAQGQGNNFCSEVNPHPTPAYARMGPGPGVGGASF